MKFNALTLNQLIARTNVQSEDRKYLVAIALSKTIGYALALPTSAVDSYSKWFEDNHRSAVETLLGQINELSVINIDECYTLTFKVWKMRYKLVFDSRAMDTQKFLNVQFDNDSVEIPEIYRTVYQRLGSESVNNFVRDVSFALTVEQAV